MSRANPTDAEDWWNAVIEVLVPLDVPLDADRATLDEAVSNAVDRVLPDDAEFAAAAHAERFSEREKKVDHSYESIGGGPWRKLR